MVGLVILFLLGVVVGGLAVIVNDQIVNIRTEKLEKTNRQLREKIHVDRIEYERNKAYRKGYLEGSKDRRK